MASFDQLNLVRASLADTAKSTLEYLKKIKEELSQINLDLTSKVSFLIESKLSGSDISDSIKDMKMLDSLSIIHGSLSKYQRLSSEIRLKIINSSTSKFNDAKSTLNMEKNLASSSESLIRYVSTATQKENEVNYIFARSIKAMSDIESEYKSIVSLVNFVDEQISYLNRLDSSIRLSYNIKASGDYLDQTTGSSVNGHDKIVRMEEV